jgi:hypothetical protein
MNLSPCGPCDSCEDTLAGLNAKVISIADSRLYNIRYELGRPVDYPLFTLFRFYREVLKDICNEADCDCYGTDVEKAKIIERIKILTA